ncbi:hypothetical protein JKP88DRAFT_280522 [Tribonema minus]|uniref:Uncharacterized protein n=1 Tax=Tribonema minus TaxID=303371 RepID=A0A836CCK5_9STRA|nr:hypothetical protein JKP88DRAFT_280522 [Tribonema minus]
MASPDIIGTNDVNGNARARMTTLVPAIAGNSMGNGDAARMLDSMINTMRQGTWVPFETAINTWLEANGMSMADFDNLTSILHGAYTDTSHLTQVPWLMQLGQYLLDNDFNLRVYDCCNLEILTYIITSMTTPVPLSQQDVWENRASLVYAKITELFNDNIGSRCFCGRSTGRGL